MSLKISELVAKTKESRSTILYYVKEGLIPPPEKLKTNVHLYDEKCVQLIKFIRYLQQNLSYSIRQVQSILQVNNFDSSNSYEALSESLAQLSGDIRYTESDVSSMLEITIAELNEYQDKGFICPSESGYSQHDVEALNVLLRIKQNGFDSDLLEQYADLAKALAALEVKMGDKILSHADKQVRQQYRLLLDLILIYKPYIFRAQSLDAQQSLKENSFEHEPEKE